MKITDVETIYLRIPDLDANRCDGTQDTLIIRVHTDEGIIGVGEVDSVPLVSKAIVEAPPSHSIATGLRSLLIGENPMEIEKIWDKMYNGTIYFGRTGPALHTMSGVDIACWDIIGKATNRTVSEMMGGVFRNKIRCYASAIMPETPLEASLLAEKYVNLGYTAIKFGWGPIGRDPLLDRELIHSIRSAVGDDIDIMIDAGLAWDLKEAINMAKMYEQYNLYWLEEPLNSNDIKGYNLLSKNSNIHIAGGEQESGRLTFQRLLDEANLDIIQPDLARCGGLTEGKKIAYMAYDRHKKIVPHAFKTGVLVAASTHFTASIPNGFLVEYTVSESPLARNLVKNPIQFKNGYLELPKEKPGLGIELDENVINKYRVN